jgi:hypothetical protein
LPAIVNVDEVSGDLPNLPLGGSAEFACNAEKRRRDTLKKLVLLTALLAMVVVAAVPALAQQNGHNHNWWGHNNSGGVSQTNEQNVESGDSSQNFTVTGGGDNSNACQGIQGISNTGNSVNSTNVLQYASLGEIGVKDSGNFEISPSQTTTCDQKVNQAASASG